MIRPGDSGSSVKELQRTLNNLGSMLLLDGQFGPSTSDAVTTARQALGIPGPVDVDDTFQTALASVPDLFPPLTTSGVTFIARAEVGSAKQYKQHPEPCLPSATSGITIGIGYDCQFVTRDQLFADWTGKLPNAALDRLAGCLGVVGTPALLTPLKDLQVPLNAAMSVFATRSLQQYLDQTRSIYPQIDALSEARRTALVSIVYNRGPRLTDKDSTRQDRLEMRKIRDLLSAGNVDAVADQIDAMARLWGPGPTPVPGLVERRHSEAALWRGGFAAVQL
jgi:peptidoglycan hydrolase-like protein with peptidoglycan-binding domain